MNHRIRRLLIVAVPLFLAGCASAAVAPLPAPPKVSQLPTSTTLADFSDVSLQRVNGTTTTVAVPFRGGKAMISGRVTMGGAPMGGATVRIERFDGDAAAGSLDVTSNADGTYKADSLHGGRYRVRAFRSPDATTAQAQVFFLGATEQRSLDLGMAQYSGGTTVNASISPDPPTLGMSASLTITVSTRGVDSNGVARSIPSANVLVTLSSSGGRGIVSANPTSTGTNGKASFIIQCNALDRQGLFVTVPGAAPTPVSVSACELPTTTTTSLSTTSTTVGAQGQSTTSTTKKK